MRFVALASCLILCSCTTFYHNGQKVFSTTANVTGLVITKEGDIQVSRIDSSGVVRSYGSVIGTATAGALPIVTSAIRP